LLLLGDTERLTLDDGEILALGLTEKLTLELGEIEGLILEDGEID